MLLSPLFQVKIWDQLFNMYPWYFNTRMSHLTVSPPPFHLSCSRDCIF